MRRLIGLALLASALASGHALAQTTTTCQNLGGIVQCRTTAPPTSIAPPDYSSYLTPSNQDPFAAVNAGARQAQEMAQRLNRTQVGKLVAAGRCDEAMQQALRYGDFDLAQQVKAICK